MTTKQIDKQIEQAYYKLACGKQINILDIGKLYAGARADIVAGKSAIEAVTEQIDRYCM